MEKVLKSRRKIKPIARRRHNWAYLLLAIIFSFCLFYLLVNTSPLQPINIQGINIPTKPLFIIALAGMLYSLSTFLFIQRIQGLLIAGFSITYLILRFVGLTHWLFLILFIALFVTLELFILKKK